MNYKNQTNAIENETFDAYRTQQKEIEKAKKMLKKNGRKTFGIKNALIKFYKYIPNGGFANFPVLISLLFFNKSSNKSWVMVTGYSSLSLHVNDKHL